MSGGSDIREYSGYLAVKQHLKQLAIGEVPAKDRPGALHYGMLNVLVNDFEAVVREANAEVDRVRHAAWRNEDRLEEERNSLLNALGALRRALEYLADTSRFDLRVTTHARAALLQDDDAADRARGASND